MSKNTTEQYIKIEWNYKPPSYFEEKLILEREGYSIGISEGSITAHMTANFFDSSQNMLDSLTMELHNYFLGAQVVRRQAFEISGGPITRRMPDGRKHTTIALSTAVMKYSSWPVDLAYIDSQGRAHDTRRDRIDIMKKLADSSARYASTDQTLRKMLESFDAAVRDPGNELVHLYEVWEALSQKFQGESAVKDALGISNNARSKLGRLANDEPLNQGRHRGRYVGSLRDATIEELGEARAIARDLIVSYSNYLDKENADGGIKV